MYKTTVEESKAKTEVVFFPPLPRPLEVPRVELEPRENDAFRLKPRPPLPDPVDTQGSGQSDRANISTGRRTDQIS